MNEIKLKGVYETIYHEKLNNGLNIYVWPSKTAHFFQGVLTVFYGADYLDFTYNNRRRHVNRGSAHYLEHIMCENDEPLLVKFNKIGSYSNAHTNYNHTSYEFVGTTKLKENINLLFSAIFEKNFLASEVEHERIPILEEQRMRGDNPDVISYFAMNDLLYQKYPNKIDLGGRKEDICAITVEELKLIYDAFYNPENMAFIITGNVDAYEVVKIIKEYFNDQKIKTWQKPKLMNYKEGRKLNNKKKTIKTTIRIPEVIIASKIPLSLFKEYDNCLLTNIISFLLTSNFGSTTEFKEELLEKKLIYNLFYTTYIMYDYLIIEVGCRTKYPEEMAKILSDKLTSMKIYPDDFKRKIKSAIKTLVLSYENVEEVNTIINNSLIYYGKIISNEKEMLENIKIEDIKKIYKKLNWKETATLINLPKEKTTEK